MSAGIFRSFALSLLWAILFSLFASVLVCFGFGPDVRSVCDRLCPLFGIWVGTSLAMNDTPAALHPLKIGAATGLLFVFIWLGFWFYVEGRLNPLAWFSLALTHLTTAHLVWWAATILVAIAAALAGARLARPLIWAQAILLVAALGCAIRSIPPNNRGDQQTELLPGCDLHQWPAAQDGTIVRLLSFDFTKQSHFDVGIFDCTRDDKDPEADANTTYMGQSLRGLASRLNADAAKQDRRLVCACNGGFFGARGMAVGQHEEPIVQDGVAHYIGDRMRPKDQTWFFAFQPTSSAANQARFQMLPRMSPKELAQYRTVLGGVRPLRLNGQSLPLAPGAGGTKLRCSRTSVGWSADGRRFYLLNVFDPDSEGASHLQQILGWTQTGGFDIRQVQKFWEDQQIPFAVLFDGGDSTQLAFRNPQGNFSFLPSCYQYSFTLGYLWQRPLRFALPILPPEEAHRGVLNYLYVDAPVAE